MKELLELCEFIDYGKELEIKSKLWQYTLTFKGIIITENNINEAVKKMKEELNKIIQQEQNIEDNQNYIREVS